MGFIGNFFSIMKYKRALTKGLDAYKKQNYTTALPFFETAVKTRPQEYHPYYLRGLTNQTLGNASEAIKDFNRALELEPEAVKNLYYFRALAFMQLRDYPAAIEDFKKTSENDKEDPIPYYRKALCLQETGKVDDAVEALNKAIELNPQFGDAYFIRSLLYFDSGNTALSLLDIQKAIEHDAKEYQDEVQELKEKLEAANKNQEENKE